MTWQNKSCLSIISMPPPLSRPLPSILITDRPSSIMDIYNLFNITDIFHTGKHLLCAETFWRGIVPSFWCSHCTTRRAEIHLAPGPGAEGLPALGRREKAVARPGASRGFADLISPTFPTGSSPASWMCIQLQPARRTPPASQPSSGSTWRTPQFRWREAFFMVA